MSSPIFDSTFGTGRFRREEPMTTDQSQSDTEPKQDVRGALEAVELVVSYALIAMDCNRKNDVLPMSGQDVERARIGLKTIRAALAQSDDALKTRFEEWAFTRGHRNFTKSGGGYLLPEIQKDWLAFKAGATALLPDCPTDGVAARQGNGG